MKFLCLLLVFGCAQVTSLNMKKHQFGQIPTKIIWFQIAGLEEEQIAMLRFQYSGDKKSSFEENVCIGKTWGYNFYDLRPKAEASFLSQLTGQKNIKSTCDDAQLRPIWSYLSGNGYTTAILESGANKTQSILSFNECGERGASFLTSLHFWLRQAPLKDEKTYHLSENIIVEENTPFYNRSCQGQRCASSIQDDFKVIYQAFKKTSTKHLLIVRDFSFLNALEKKEIGNAREILFDLERSLSEALKLAGSSSDYLVLVSSGDSRFIDMPNPGKDWFEFEKTGKNANTKRAKLTNLVIASGARAENFCGIYDDSQIFERVLSGPKQLGLELKFINPFK